MSPSFWIATGALLASPGVTAGAVGTHVLKEVLEWPENKLETFEMAVRYQMYHALGLIVGGLLGRAWPSRWLTAAGWLFLAGHRCCFRAASMPGWPPARSRFVQSCRWAASAWIVGWLLVAIGAWRIRSRCLDRVG